MQLLMQGLGKEAATDVAKPNENAKSDVPQEGDSVFATYVEVPTDSVDVESPAPLQLGVSNPKSARPIAEGNDVSFNLKPADVDLRIQEAPLKQSIGEGGKEAALQALPGKLQSTTMENLGPRRDGDASSVTKTLGTQSLSPAMPNELNALASKATSVGATAVQQGTLTKSNTTNEKAGDYKKDSAVVASSAVALPATQTTDTDLPYIKPNVELGQVDDVRATRRGEIALPSTPQAPTPEVTASMSKSEQAARTAGREKFAANVAGKSKPIALELTADTEQLRLKNNNSVPIPDAVPKVVAEIPQLRPFLSPKAEARASRLAAQDPLPDASPLQGAQGATSQDSSQTVQISVFKSEASLKDGIFTREAAHGPAEASNLLATGESSDAKRTIDQVLNRTESAAKPVVSQLVQAAKAGIDGTIEVKLSPEELGRVKMTMMPGETGMTVQVMAERPETLDLIRRNIDMLASDLSEQGFQDLSFSFGDDATNGDETPNGTGNGKSGAAGMPQDQSNPLHYSMAINDGRLDIRL